MRYLPTIALLCLAFALAAQNEPLLRFPALNADGSQLAFSYQGDIWTVPASGGVARRLTIHESYERFPQWSPDGEKLVFQGNRYGNDDIFVIDAQGGTPLRLTYHSASDNTPQWRYFCIRWALVSNITNLTAVTSEGPHGLDCWRHRVRTFRSARLGCPSHLKYTTVAVSTAFSDRSECFGWNQHQTNSVSDDR